MSTALHYSYTQYSLMHGAELHFSEYFHQFLDALPLGLIWLDQKGLVKKQNKLSKILLSQDDLIGRPWRDIIQQILANAGQGYEIVLKNGRRLDVTTQAAPSFENPMVLEQIILLNDVTEARRLQLRLEQEDRFRELGVISATLSHQLKTPLSTALLYANQLHDYELTKPQRERASDQVVQQLNYMTRQVNDLLFFVKGDLPVDCSATLGDLLKATLQANRASLSQFEFILTCAPELAIESLNCHFDALVGALSNLITNACEAAPLKSQIKLRVQKINDSHQQGFYYFDVSDSGPGFHPKARAYFGTKAFSTKSGGSGLGLRFVKTVAEKHGGHIRFIHQQQGSCIGIAIPFFNLSSC